VLASTASRGLTLQQINSTMYGADNGDLSGFKSAHVGWNMGTLVLKMCSSRTCQNADGA